MDTLKEIRRRLQPAEKGEWNRLLSSAKKARKEEDTGEGSQRARDLQKAMSRAQQSNIRGACHAFVERDRAPHSQDTVEEVKNMCAMDVTSDELKELECARKDANSVRSNAPEMTTGAVKRRIRALKAGAAPVPSGLGKNT